MEIRCHLNGIKVVNTQPCVPSDMETDLKFESKTKCATSTFHKSWGAWSKTKLIFVL